jgi:RimJ/RimL family protein N-acetyltransferase
MIAGEHVILRAFERGDADRVNVFDYNDRAKHVLLTNGFVQEGMLTREFYREGTYHDIVILSVFRDSVAAAEGHS